MSTEYAPGLHAVSGRASDASAYDRWIGRWSRLFVPSLLAAAQSRRRAVGVPPRPFVQEAGRGMCDLLADRAPMFGVLVDTLSKFMPERRTSYKNPLHSPTREGLKSCLRVPASETFRSSARFAWIPWRASRNIGSR